MSTLKSIGSVDHFDVANYFLAVANETGDVLTNLKLQKLVYYAQAWYLANFKNPIFKADFEAWIHGPVIPELYQKYKVNGSAPIVTSLKLAEINLETSLISFLSEVAKVYMPYTAFELEAMTHREKPWTDARDGYDPDQPCEKVITKNSMRDYYGEKITKDKTN